MDTKLLSIHGKVESSQSKNCWLYVQIGTTAFYFWRPWRMDNTDTAWRIEICVPDRA